MHDIWLSTYQQKYKKKTTIHASPRICILAAMSCSSIKGKSPNPKSVLEIARRIVTNTNHCVDRG